MLKALLLTFAILSPFETQDYTVVGDFHDARGFTYHQAIDANGYRLLFVDENLTHGTVKRGDTVTGVFLKTMDDEGELLKVIKR
ncbi:hypothetical protein D3C75_232730 [compost metagenome]